MAPDEGKVLMSSKNSHKGTTHASQPARAQAQPDQEREAMQDLRVQRSRHAFGVVRSLSKEVFKALPGLPVLIRTQGLPSAFVVLRRNESGGGSLVQYMISWLSQWSGMFSVALPREGIPEFLVAYVKLDGDHVAALEAEAVRYAEVLKDFGKLLSPSGN